MSFHKVVKTLTPKQRLAKFRATVDKSHKWSFIDSDSEPVTYGPRCIGCNKLIQVVSSVYGRVISDRFQVIREGTRTIDSKVFEYRRIYGVPVYRTGYCCNPCFDHLWSDQWYDDKLALHRSIELLNHPITKTTETVSKNGRTMVRTVPLSRSTIQTRDDSYDRGKGERKSVTTVFLDHGEEVEEWKTSLPPIEKEPVDVKAYNYFNRGRR
jgi:hypothetical protein